MTSLSMFFNFLYIHFFNFGAVKGEKGKKMAQADIKIMPVALHISGTIYHVIVFYGTLF